MDKVNADASEAILDSLGGDDLACLEDLACFLERFDCLDCLTLLGDACFDGGEEDVLPSFALAAASFFFFLRCCCSTTCRTERGVSNSCCPPPYTEASIPSITNKLGISFTNVWTIAWSSRQTGFPSTRSEINPLNWTIAVNLFMSSMRLLPMSNTSNMDDKCSGSHGAHVKRLPLAWNSVNVGMGGMSFHELMRLSATRNTDNLRAPRNVFRLDKRLPETSKSCKLSNLLKLGWRISMSLDANTRVSNVPMDSSPFTLVILFRLRFKYVNLRQEYMLS